MADTMNAVVYYGPGDVRYQQMPIPTCEAGGLLVEVEACAVCGSDLKTYKVGNPRMRQETVMGHEFAGIIREIGPEAEAGDLAIGDRIVMATSVACGECLYCKRGWRNICQNIKPMGFHFDGGIAEWCAIPAAAVSGGHVVKVPEGLAPEFAALAEPISCAVNSVEQCNIEEGDVVLVMGAGPMGLLNAAVARAAGAGKIILSEPNAERLKQAEPFCDILVNPMEQDLPAIIAAETAEGLGADVAIVAAPAAQPQAQALELVRKRGTVCLFASLPVGNEMLTINSRTLHYGELRLVGTSDSTADHVRTGLRYLQEGKIDGSKIATHLLGRDEIEKAFELMISGESLRVVLR